MWGDIADTGFAKAAQAQRGGLSLPPISPYLPHISPISRGAMLRTCAPLVLLSSLSMPTTLRP